MKYIKSFNESQTLTYPREEHEVLRLLQLITPKLGDNTDIIRRCEVNSRGEVDVISGNIVISPEISPETKELKQLPIKFGHVSGTFRFGASLWSPLGTLNITSLEGSPEYCLNFDATSTKITDLNGGPKHVPGNYRVYDVRYLKSLEGAPSEVGGEFNISETGIKSLKGSPKRVGIFGCNDNNIKSLVGGPEHTDGTYDVGNCLLTSLEGAPKSCESFIAHSRSGALLDPQRRLWDPRPLKGCSYEKAYFAAEPIQSLMNLFRSKEMRQRNLSKDFLDSLDYNYVRDDRQINLFRLKEALDELGLVDNLYDSDISFYRLVDDDGNLVDKYGEPLD